MIPDLPNAGDVLTIATRSSPHSFAARSRKSPKCYRYSRLKGMGTMNDTQVVRRSNRMPIAAKASLRLTQGTKFDVAVTNLTSEGCCIAARYLSLRTGDYVTLKLADLEYLRAIVRWSNDAMVGLEFTRPLYGPVAEHLQARLCR